MCECNGCDLCLFVVQCVMLRGAFVMCDCACEPLDKHVFLCALCDVLCAVVCVCGLCVCVRLLKGECVLCF